MADRMSKWIPLRRWSLLLVMAVVAALSSAESCTTPSEPGRQRCDFINAADRQSCDATAARNGCRSHAFAELTNVCTGFECTSCGR